MKVILRRFLHFVLPSRMAKFFYGDGQRTWRSPRRVEEIHERLLATLPASRAVGWTHAGIYGRMKGDSLWVGWKIRSLRNSFAPVFHGTVTEDPETGGSILQGVFSAERVAQGFMTFWVGSLLLFGLVMVWTVVAPLMAWGMLWLGAGIMKIGDAMMPDMEDRIGRYLVEISSPEISVRDIETGTE